MVRREAGAKTPPGTQARPNTAAGEVVRQQVVIHRLQKDLQRANETLARARLGAYMQGFRAGANAFRDALADRISLSRCVYLRHMAELTWAAYTTVKKVVFEEYSLRPGCQRASWGPAKVTLQHPPSAPIGATPVHVVMPTMAGEKKVRGIAQSVYASLVLPAPPSAPLRAIYVRANYWSSLSRQPKVRCPL
jgi:hypothetical protein